MLTGLPSIGPRLSLLEERLILRAVVTRVLPLRTPCVSVSGEGTAVAGAAALGIAAPLAPMTIARAAAVRFIAAPAPGTAARCPALAGRRLRIRKSLKVLLRNLIEERTRHLILSLTIDKADSSV